jgi:hypothetical protein
MGQGERYVSASSAPSTGPTRRLGSRLGLIFGLVALALLLVPAAQAAAAGTMQVAVAGNGEGEVSSVGGIGAFENEGGAYNATFESFGNAFEGSPPIECHSPEPGAGTCETPLVTSEALEGVESIALHAVPAPGSEFVGWIVEEGAGTVVGCEVGGPLTEEGENPTFCLQGGPGENGDIRVTATFHKPSLTINKTGTGSGSVVCKFDGGAAESCDGPHPRGSEVELVATPKPTSEPAVLSGTGSAGACGPTSPCVFTLEEDSTVTVEFNNKPGVVNFGLTTDAGTGTGSVTCNGGPCEEAYENGETVHLVENPGPNSVLAGWSVTGATGVNTCTGAVTECEIEITEPGPIALTVTFNLEKHVLTVAKGGTGTGTVTGGSVAEPNTISCGTGTGCEHEYAHGEIVTLKGAPDAGTAAVVWGGCDAIVGTDECEVAMTAVKSVTATFDLEPVLTVTKAGTGAGTVVSVPAGTISCGTGPGCEHAYAPGSIVKLKGTPGANTQAVVWSGCDAIVGANECEVTMTAAKGVTATFNLVKHKLTVAKSGSGSGTVTSSPAGINCGTGSGCEFEFEHNAVVTLTALAGENTQTVAWEGCASEPSPTECKVTMSAAKEVKAKFNLVTHTLTVSKAGTGTGSVTCNGGACAASYEVGTSVTLAAAPGSGSTFAGWSGGGCAGAGSCVVTISADTAVTATFSANASPPPPPPPAEEKCIVPKLKGLALGKAKSALTKAHCKAGKVSKPKKAKGPLVVKSSKPPAGTVLAAGSKVNLKLAPKPKKGKK